MKIEHARVGGIYKVIADVIDDENKKVVLPKDHIVKVQNVLDAVDAIMVEDLTEYVDTYIFVKSEDLDYVTLKDLYGEDYQQAESEPNKDSPHYNSHYTNMIGLQPIELMQETLSPEEFRGFLKGNIIKYTMRAGHKEGESAEKDAAKAKVYLKWLNDAKGYIPIRIDR